MILIAIVLGAYVLAVIFGLALCKAGGRPLPKSTSRGGPAGPVSSGTGC